MLQRQLNEEASQQVAVLIKQLGSWKVSERYKAEHSLGKLGPEAIEPLLARWREEAEKRALRISIGNVAAIFVLMLLEDFCFGQRHGRQAYLLAAVAGGVGAGISRQIIVSRSQEKVLGVLSNSEDLRIIGPLLEALTYPRKRVRSLAAAALIRLLPRLRAGNVPFLTDKQRKRLHDALTGRSIELKLATLKALEQIGDSRDLPYVEKLAARTGKADKNSVVGDAARACLPFLRQRTDGQRADQTLLRPTSASDVPRDTLLRAAEKGQETDPRQLLRAGTSKDNG